MQLTEEFFVMETEKSPDYSSVSFFPGGQPGDPRANFAEEAAYNKKVRLLRCAIVEVMEEQT